MPHRVSSHLKFIAILSAFLSLFTFSFFTAESVRAVNVICVANKIVCTKDNNNLCPGVTTTNPSLGVGQMCNADGTGYYADTCQGYVACGQQVVTGTPCDGRYVAVSLTSSVIVGCSSDGKDALCDTTSFTVGQRIDNTNLFTHLVSDSIYENRYCNLYSAPIAIPPKGYATNICTGVFGWACDGANYSTALNIYAYLDEQDPAHLIPMTVVANKTTGNPVEDAHVAAQCNGNAAHFYSFGYPATMSPGPHKMWVTAGKLNSAGVSDSTTQYLLPGTSTGTNLTIDTSSCPVPSPTPPPPRKGYATSNCVGVFGWACDGKDYSKTLNVRAFLDAHDTSHLMVVDVPANQVTGNPVEDARVAAQCNGNAAHFYSFNYPANMSAAPHQIWVEAGALNTSNVSDANIPYSLPDTTSGGIVNVDRSACPTPPPNLVCGGVTCTIPGADQTAAPTKQVSCVMNPLDSTAIPQGATASYEASCTIMRSGVSFGGPTLVPVADGSSQFRPFTLSGGTLSCQFRSCITQNSVKTCTPWPIPGSQPL